MIGELGRGEPLDADVLFDPFSTGVPAITGATDEAVEAVDETSRFSVREPLLPGDISSWSEMNSVAFRSKSRESCQGLCS